MPIVDIKNVGRVQFPDKWTPDQIHQAAEKLYMRNNPPAAGAARPNVNMQESTLGHVYDTLETGGNIGSKAQVADELANNIQNSRSGAVALGAVKGVVSTGYNTARLIDSKLPPKPASLNPDSGWEKAGFYGEQAGEFFAPEMLLGDLGKANLLTRMLRSGAVSGVVGAMQSGSAKQGAVDAGVGVVSQPIAEGAGYAARKAGDAILNSALNISGAKLRRLNPAQYLIDNGGMNFLRSAAGMRDVAEDEASKAYNTIASRAAANPTMVDLQPTVAKGQSFMDQWGREQLPNLQAQGRAIMDIPTNVSLRNPVSYPGAPDYLTVPRNPQLPVEGALDVRRGLGKIKTWNANNFFEPPAVSMRDSMYGTLSDSLYNAAPELQTPMEQYANYATVADSIDRKSSMWPSLMAGGFGLAHGGPASLMEMIPGYHMATSAPAGYMLGKAGKYLPYAIAAGRNLGLATADNINNFNPSSLRILPNPFAPQP